MDFEEFFEKIVKENKKTFQANKKITPHIVFTGKSNELNVVVFADCNEVDFREALKMIINEADWRVLAVVLSGDLRDLKTGEKIKGMIIQAVSVDGDCRAYLITESGEEKINSARGYLSLTEVLKEVGV